MPPCVKGKIAQKRKNRPSRIENSMAGAENLESPNGHAYFALARERWETKWKAILETQKRESAYYAAFDQTHQAMQITKTNIQMTNFQYGSLRKVGRSFAGSINRRLLCIIE